MAIMVLEVGKVVVACKATGATMLSPLLRK